MNFQYFATKVVNADIEVDDIGNCALQAFNDRGEEYNLIIETNLGTCRSLVFGPVSPDFDLLPEKLSIQFERFNFSQKTISKMINRFLNDPYKNITQAFTKTKEELLVDLPDLKEYMNQIDFW